MTTEDVRHILCGSLWSAGHHFYDYNQDYEFFRDGTARFSFGYAQAMRLQVSVGYRLLSANEIEFYPTQPDSWWLPNPVRTHLVLETGTYEVACQTMSDEPLVLLFSACLRFDADPLEEAADPWERSLPYYGWRVDSERLDAPARVLELRLKHWAEADGTGYAEGADTSLFFLPDGNEYAVSASWAKKEAWSMGVNTMGASGHVPIVPDMIACIVDEPAEFQTSQQTIETFITHGTRLAWLFDRRTKQVCEYRDSKNPILLENPVELFGGSVLPGLHLSTSWIL